MGLVAPYMGAWIEIKTTICMNSCHYVAPYMGAWIEIFLPLLVAKGSVVAPYMGAWIEIDIIRKLRDERGCRTLHGCVD